MAGVRDVIDRRNLSWVDARKSVADAARRMAELRCGAILVLEDDKLKGMFSERDLMLRVVLQQLDPEQTPVSAVMSTDLVTIDEKASVEQAMEAMQSHKCRHLPVLREGAVIALLSMRDVMNFELATKTEELRHMRAYIQSNV